MSKTVLIKYIYQPSDPVHYFWAHPSELRQEIPVSFRACRGREHCCYRAGLENWLTALSQPLSVTRESGLLHFAVPTSVGVTINASALKAPSTIQIAFDRCSVDIGFCWDNWRGPALQTAGYVHPLYQPSWKQALVGCPHSALPPAKGSSVFLPQEAVCTHLWLTPGMCITIKSFHQVGDLTKMPLYYFDVQKISTCCLTACTH